MQAGQLLNSGYTMLVGGICHLCVSIWYDPPPPPRSSPPALMRIWSTHAHTHTRPYGGTAERKCPPSYPSTLLDFSVLPAEPQDSSRCPLFSTSSLAFPGRPGLLHVWKSADHSVIPQISKHISAVKHRPGDKQDVNIENIFLSI